jgi:polyhydroxyalkanoate synthesis regulator phasin
MLASRSPIPDRISVGGHGRTICDTPGPMARRPSQQVPDAVREAVERTIQATVGSAQITRERAQEAVDEIVRGAGAGAETLRERIAEAFDERRPVTNEDLKEIRSELRAIARRLDSIEKRLPAKRSSGSSGTRKPKS